MAWQTPKTDWATDDGIGTTDLNRIEGNIDSLHSGSQKSGGNIISASSLDIAGSKFFIVTGNNNIMYMSTVGRATGDIVYLMFTGTLTIHNNEGSVPANYAAIQVVGGDFTPNDNCYAFIFDGTYWRYQQ